MILESGMILCLWQAAARRLLDCASQAIRSAKCQGNFFTVFHMQRGKEEGEKKPHAALRQGRRQTGPPSSGCACQGSDASDIFLCSRSGLRSLCLTPQTPVHLRPPRRRQHQRSPAAGRALGEGLHHWACATAVCFPACWLQEASALEPGPPWAVSPCGTAAGPRCSPEASGLGGKAPQGSQ